MEFCSMQLNGLVVEEKHASVHSSAFDALSVVSCVCL
jgi:hypothetical protein